MRKLLLCVLLLGCSANARYTLHEDNDYFKPTKNNDVDFSQGLRIDREIPTGTGTEVIFIGQNFYTPGHKQLTAPQPDDRPYAGFLYAGTDIKDRKSHTEQTVYGFVLGIVGPHSYAEQTQNTVHRLLGQNTAKGWDNQLDDEPGIILKAEKDYALPLNKNFDTVAVFGVHLGNVFTQAYTGLELRTGWNLPDPFLSPGIVYPRLPKKGEADSSSWSWYVLASAWGRAVAHNIFLDGNTFEDSLSVEKYPFVAEGRLGFAVHYNDYRVAYTYIAQTKEFKTQTYYPNDFGEITISVDW